MEIAIARTWDGAPARPDERVRLSLRRSTSGGLDVSIDAPFHGDPPPPGAAGPTPGLWKFEVVELYVLGDDGHHYLELEFSPHGHWLALELHGRRRIVRSENDPKRVRYAARRSAAHFTGRAEVDAALLPARPRFVNAYAIHGTGPARRHLAWQAIPGSEPDFHCLGAFAPFDFAGLPVGR